MAEQDLTGQHLKVYVTGQGPLGTHRRRSRSPRSSFRSAEDEHVGPIEPPPQRNRAAAAIAAEKGKLLECRPGLSARPTFWT